MKANTDIDEKALHWFVALRDEAAGLAGGVASPRPGL